MVPRVRTSESCSRPLDSAVVPVYMATSPTAAGRDPMWMTATPSEWMHIRSADLGEAQVMRTRVRRDHLMRGRQTRPPEVILELEVHIAAEARTARKELTAARVGLPASVRYLGTSSGLAGLISDIKAARVADGVLITPLVTSCREALCDRLITEVMPLLLDTGPSAVASGY